MFYFNLNFMTDRKFLGEIKSIIALINFVIYDHRENICPVEISHWQCQLSLAIRVYELGANLDS